MPERASIFQVTQLGLETTPGTAVAADTRLMGLNFSLGIRPDVKVYRPSGSKFATVAALNREWTEMSFEGPATYTDLTYLLASLVNKPTPSTTGTTGKLWSFAPDSDGADTIATYTVEHGSSERADEFAYAIVNDLTLTFNRDGVEVAGSMIGKAIDPDISLSGSVSELALVPITAPQVTFKTASTQAGLSGATALTRVKSMEWSLASRFAPAWYMNGSTSFGAHVETEPEGQVKLLIAADDTGMAYLTDMRDGDTVFVRAAATGAVIGAGPATYAFQLDTAIKLTDVGELRDEEGVYAIEWTGILAHDSTWGKAFQIDLTNGIAAL